MGVLECHQLIAVPITTEKKRYSRLSVVTPFQLRPEKKRYSCLAIIRCAIPIAIVAPFQLRLEKKKIQSSVCCYTIPSTTRKKKDTVVWPSFAAPFQLPLLVAPFQLRLEKKRYSCLSVVTPFQLQPEIKDTVVWTSFVAPFQLPLLRHSNYNLKKKIQLSVRCYAVPNTTGKKKNLAGARSLLRLEKKSSSRLSGGCMIIITTEKKVLVVCWAQQVFFSS
jgi:hypothetical protein